LVAADEVLHGRDALVPLVDVHPRHQTVVDEPEGIKGPCVEIPAGD
jgi:hypothetical protein